MKQSFSVLQKEVHLETPLDLAYYWLKLDMAWLSLVLQEVIQGEYSLDQVHCLKSEELAQTTLILNGVVQGRLPQKIQQDSASESVKEGHRESSEEFIWGSP